ncbi:MAG: acetylxylan esterase, partial [Planctomycetes bacterium]|nr:acetylxylan esterase [Planctomycetota bacterium]
VYPLAGPEAAPERCSLWIGIHGYDVDLSNMPAGDDIGKRYWTAGIESPKTSMWRTIYISLVRAVDFMLAQPEVDAKRVAVVGGSQGGGLAMVAAALDPRVGFCMPYHSGLPRLDWTVKHEPGYWPFSMAAKPQGQTEEQFLKTLSYFDPANFTQDIRCPVAAEVGMMDTVTAAGNQVCALAHVPKGRLFLVCSPWAMHGAGSRAPGLIGECYNRFLKGEPPILTPTRP